MDPDAEIEFELFPLIRVYKSGRVERLLETEVLPAATDPTTAVTSKDVIIDPTTTVSARLYLPPSSQNKKLPILVYFHGGGFIIETAFSPTYHHYLNLLVSHSSVLAVSVDYRRLPDHPLPAAYHDSWSALQWLFSSSPDPWLVNHGDFSRVFLAGDSAGANIAHHMALRAGTDPTVRIKGMALDHPYFWGSEPIGSEVWGEETVAMMEGMWRIVCPLTSGLDDPMVNPFAEGAAALEGLACERVMVSVAEKDFLKERGREYYERLRGSGWGGEVEFLESEGENHVFHLQKLTCEKAVEKMERMVAFLNRE